MKKAPAATARATETGPGSAHDFRIAIILERIRRIPRGKVQTYSGIDPIAPRLVGRVLATTAVDVPWHRVVRADGTMAKGRRQRALLVAEGVPMRGERVDLRAALSGAPGNRPRTVGT